MNWLINAIWYLPATAVAFGLFYPIWWLGLRAFRVRGRWARFASIPVFAAIVLGSWKYATRPTAVYAEAFGFPPSADVHDLKSDRYLVGQSGGVYLRFRADPATIERIIGRGFVPMDMNYLFRLQGDMRGGHAPKWWRVQDLAPGSQFYHATAANKNSYNTISEYLAYDRSARLVLFKRNDVD